MTHVPIVVRVVPYFIDVLKAGTFRKQTHCFNIYGHVMDTTICRIPKGPSVTVSMTTIDLIKKTSDRTFCACDHFLNSPLRRFQTVHCLYISVSFTFVIV